MREWRPVILGFFMAVVSIAILAGSFLLSIVEGEPEIMEEPTATYTLTRTPLTTQFIIPGKSTRTATSTSIATNTSTPTFIPPSACPPPAGWVAIIVLPDDTLSKLAEIYQSDKETLAYGNCLEPEITTLQPGVVFYVPRPSPFPTIPASPLPSPTNLSMKCEAPPGWIVYIVQYGDTLSSLSQRLNVSGSQLREVNCIDSSARIYVGQELFVPFVPPVMPSQPPRPPAVTPFLLTPVYNFPPAPSGMNNQSPSGSIAVLTETSPVGLTAYPLAATGTPAAFPFLSCSINEQGWSE
jgi:hypothetical protein